MKCYTCSGIGMVRISLGQRASDYQPCQYCEAGRDARRAINGDPLTPSSPTPTEGPQCAPTGDPQNP